MQQENINLVVKNINREKEEEEEEERRKWVLRRKAW